MSMKIAQLVIQYMQYYLVQTLLKPKDENVLDFDNFLTFRPVCKSTIKCLYIFQVS